MFIALTHSHLHTLREFVANTQFFRLMQIDLKLPFMKRNKNVCISHCWYIKTMYETKRNEMNWRKREMPKLPHTNWYAFRLVFFAFTCGLIVYVIRHLSYSNGSNIHTINVDTMMMVNTWKEINCHNTEIRGQRHRHGVVMKWAKTHR